VKRQYSYVRFRWLPASLTELEEAFSQFQVEARNMPNSKNDVSPYKKFRNYVSVKSDTLVVHASPLRAVISQPEIRPFTKRDLALRETVIKEYPKITSSIFPWGFAKEPSFEVAE
jgi:hypothetical protein